MRFSETSSRKTRLEEDCSARRPPPESDALTRGLADVFIEKGRRGASLVVLHRDPIVSGSTFPSEIVTCRIDDRVLRVFCKYGRRQEGHRAYGHRRGVDYEAEVYRRVLARWGLSTPRFFGTFRDGEGDASWLFLEFLEGCLRLNKTSGTATLPQAARWIGRFHRKAHSRRGRLGPDWLNTYDARYYQGWARRTSAFAGDLHERFSWLNELCDRAESLMGQVLAPQTIIHGEFYPRNVLVWRGETCPIDWESAAIGVGEIDLASLTDGWQDDVVERCEREYRRARWPAGGGEGFGERLQTARLYLDLRWLGDRPEWTHHERFLPVFERLRVTGERLGLI